MEVLIRADGSFEMGLGHIGRMRTLAQGFRAVGVHVAFATHRSCDTALNLLAEQGHDVVRVGAAAGTDADADEVTRVASARGATLVVVDGYQFGEQYFGKLGAAGNFVCYVDDIFASTRGCCAVLNGNIYAERSVYRAPLPATALLGPSFALVGDPFRAARRPFLRRPVQHLLVTLGGSDPSGQTRKVLRGLALLGGSSALTVRVVVGGANGPHIVEEIVRASVPHAENVVQILHAVRDMAGQMAWADLAVSAAGTTCLELACIGVPALIVAVADNQRRVAEGFHDRGLMRSLGWHEEVTEAQVAREIDRLRDDVAAREAMVLAQHALVDGDGPARVSAALLEAHADWASAPRC